MRYRLIRVPVLAGLALGLAACGAAKEHHEGHSRSGEGGGGRTIEVAMVDNAFEPSQLTVRDGEKVTFVFRNRGKVAHDAFIGDAKAQADHGAEMREAGAGEHGAHGAEGDAVTVEPGGTKRLTHTFRAGDQVLIGCHQPGHFEAGMRAEVRVT